MGGEDDSDEDEHDYDYYLDEDNYDSDEYYCALAIRSAQNSEKNFWLSALLGPNDFAIKKYLLLNPASYNLKNIIPFSLLFDKLARDIVNMPRVQYLNHSTVGSFLRNFAYKYDSDRHWSIKALKHSFA